ncbi:MAG: hypothetical protein ACRD1T_26560, partial [Acidimicrobiia bacterium]
LERKKALRDYAAKEIVSDIDPSRYALEGIEARSVELNVETYRQVTGTKAPNPKPKTPTDRVTEKPRCRFCRTEDPPLFINSWGAYLCAPCGWGIEWEPSDWEEAS